MIGERWWVAFIFGLLLGDPGVCVAQPTWNDTLAFRSGFTGEMRMLLEKTLFKVDVLTVRVRYDSVTTSHITRLLETPGDPSAIEDSVALAVISSRDVLIDLEFARDVRINQFLDGVRDDMRKAVRAGFLSESAFLDIMNGLPDSFRFLEERRIREHDMISYRLHADTLRTVFRDATGEVLLDQIDVGRERRMSVVATFLAPGSGFRNGLLKSLNDGQVLRADGNSS